MGAAVVRDFDDLVITLANHYQLQGQRGWWFWLPDSFTVVSELKRAFQEAWKIMVLICLVLRMLLGGWLRWWWDDAAEMTTNDKRIPLRDPGNFLRAPSPRQYPSGDRKDLKCVPLWSVVCGLWSVVCGLSSVVRINWFPCAVHLILVLHYCKTYSVHITLLSFIIK